MVEYGLMLLSFRDSQLVLHVIRGFWFDKITNFFSIGNKVFKFLNYFLT